MRFITRLSVRPLSFGRSPAAPSGVRGIHSYANFKIPTINNEPNVSGFMKIYGNFDVNETDYHTETLHPWISRPSRTGIGSFPSETVQHSKHPITNWRQRGVTYQGQRISMMR